MFSRAQPKGVIEQLVESATSETRTSEDWATVFQLTDAVRAIPAHATACAEALALRLQHKNPNVVLLAVSLTDACYKNCGEPFHIQVVSPSPSGLLRILSRLVQTPSTNDSVRTRILSALYDWSNLEPRVNAVLIEIDNIKRAGHVIAAAPSSSAAPGGAAAASRAAEDKRKEDEEIQLALAISLSEAESRSKSQQSTQRRPVNTVVPASSNVSGSAFSSSVSVVPPINQSSAVLCRVVASYDFAGKEAGELPFKKGDTIEVLEKSHQDWWKGRIGETSGVFPANYVKEISLPDLSTLRSSLPASTAESDLVSLESQLSSSKVDLLYELLSGVDPARKNVADDDTIQELIAACTAMKPRLIEVICEYEKRRDALVELNGDFAKARATYDAMLSAAIAKKPMPTASAAVPSAYVAAVLPSAVSASAPYNSLPPPSTQQQQQMYASTQQQPPQPQYSSPLYPTQQPQTAPVAVASSAVPFQSYAVPYQVNQPPPQRQVQQQQQQVPPQQVFAPQHSTSSPPPPQQQQVYPQMTSQGHAMSSQPQPPPPPQQMQYGTGLPPMPQQQMQYGASLQTPQGQQLQYGNSLPPQQPQLQQMPPQQQPQQGQQLQYGGSLPQTMMTSPPPPMQMQYGNGLQPQDLSYNQYGVVSPTPSQQQLTANDDLSLIEF